MTEPVWTGREVAVSPDYLWLHLRAHRWILVRYQDGTAILRSLEGTRYGQAPRRYVRCLWTDFTDIEQDEASQAHRSAAEVGRYLRERDRMKFVDPNVIVTAGPAQLRVADLKRLVRGQSQ